MLSRVFTLSLIGALAAGGAFADPQPTPPEAPRPFTLTEAQAQDYAARLQADIRQAQAVYQAAQQTLSDLAKQTKPPSEVKK